MRSHCSEKRLTQGLQVAEAELRRRSLRWPELSAVTPNFMLVDGTMWHEVRHTAIKHPLETYHTHTHTPQCKITVNGRLCCGIHPYRFQRYVFTTVFFLNIFLLSCYVWAKRVFWLITAELSLLHISVRHNRFQMIQSQSIFSSFNGPLFSGNRDDSSLCLCGDKIIIGHLEHKH